MYYYLDKNINNLKSKTFRNNKIEAFSNSSNEIKSEGLCRRTKNLNDYGGYCLKNKGVSEDKCTEYCKDTLGCVASGHYMNDKCELLFHNRSKPNNCPTGFKSYDGAYSKIYNYKGMGSKYNGKKTVCTNLNNKLLKTKGLCRRSGNDYGGYCVKNSGVSENDCTQKCIDTPGCVAAGHYSGDACDLFFQNKTKPNNCPNGFKSYQGLSTKNINYEGTGSNYGRKKSVCTNLNRNVLQTKGLCRRPGDDYGGYCVNKGVTENECTRQCMKTSGCVAAGHYSNDGCDLYFQNKTKPDNCPNGFKSYQGLSSKKVSYQGTGKNYVNKRTTCSTLKKDYLEVNSGKPSNEITLKECKEWAQNESSLEWKGEKTDWGNFPTGCSVYRYPGYEKNWGVYYFNAKKRKVQDCGVAHTSCVVKKKNYIEDMSGRPDNDITLNECKQWAESQSTLPWKGEKTDWGNFPTGCSIYLYPGYEKNWGVYYLNANKRTVQDCGTAYTSCVKKNVNNNEKFIISNGAYYKPESSCNTNNQPSLVSMNDTTAKLLI